MLVIVEFRVIAFGDEVEVDGFVGCEARADHADACGEFSEFGAVQAGLGLVEFGGHGFEEMGAEGVGESGYKAVVGWEGVGGRVGWERGGSPCGGVFAVD